MNRAYLIVFRTLSGGDYFVVAFEERVWDELARTKELGNSLLFVLSDDAFGDTYAERIARLVRRAQEEAQRIGATIP